MKTSPKHFAAGAFVSLLALGCGGDSAPPPQANTPVATTDLFATPAVLKLAFEISDDQLAVMRSASHTYGRGILREGGETYQGIGFRYKGAPDKEAASGKPDLKLKLNEFDSGRDFHGYKRLIFLAGRDDPSYLSAPIGLELFRDAGVPAARYSFASVQLNGRDLGLYVIVEGVDREFIGRHFRKTNGNLYDEGEDPDITSKLEKYGGGKNKHDQSDVDALAAAALQTDPARRWQELQQRLDVDRFLAYTALEVLLWQDQSYSLEADKFRIYHDPDADRLVFFPKDVEEVLDKTDGPLLPKWKGVVARAVMTTPQGQQRYRAAMQTMLEKVFIPAKVQARGKELAALVRPAAANGNAEAAKAFDAAVAQFLDAVAERARFASEQLRAMPATAAN